MDNAARHALPACPVRFAVSGAVAGATYAVLRRPWLRSGATPREVTTALPGDGLLVAPSLQATRATTLRATPEQIWPWLVQMGNGRAGWYSYDGVDNGGHRSLDHLDPALQTLDVGTQISDATGPFSFEVVVVDPPHALVYRASIHPVTGRPVDPAVTDRRSTGYAAAFLDFTWAFVLIPAPDGTTRLLVRVRYVHSASPWVWMMAQGFEAVDAVFTRRMLRGITERVHRHHLDVTTPAAPRHTLPGAA